MDGTPVFGAATAASLPQENRGFLAIDLLAPSCTCHLMKPTPSVSRGGEHELYF